MTRCIFCKQNTGTFVSSEHIVPESLGNKSHILPPGVVCDGCNNYFSRKIERKILESGYFRSLRFSQGIQNKRKNIPSEDGIILPDVSVKLIKERDGTNTVAVPADGWDKIINQKSSTLIFPVSGPKPDTKLMSRFLAKMAIEAMAQRLIGKSDLMDNLISDNQLSPIKEWARYGNSSDIWPFYERRIYDADKWHGSSDETYQILFEYDFLATNTKELYFCIALFGEEYSINIGGPSIGGYKAWLSDNNDLSPLYIDKIHY